MTQSDQRAEPEVARRPQQAAVAAANALAQAGLIRPDQTGPASTTLDHYLQPAKLEYAADFAFLLDSVAHHSTSYMETVIVPRVLAIATGSRIPGKLLLTEEMNRAATDVTSSVFSELGGPYKQRLFAYLGDEEGLATFIFTRVQRAIFAAAAEENERFMAASSRGQRKLPALLAPEAATA